VIPLVMLSERTASNTLTCDIAVRYCRIVHNFPFNAFFQSKSLASPDETRLLLLSGSVHVLHFETNKWLSARRSAGYVQLVIQRSPASSGHCVLAVLIPVLGINWNRRCEDILDPRHIKQRDLCGANCRRSIRRCLGLNMQRE
jgi:hypothetical protein